MAGLSFRAVRACALAEQRDSLYIYHSSRALSKPPSQTQETWLARHRWYSQPLVIFYQLRERGSSLRNPWVGGNLDEKLVACQHLSTMKKANKGSICPCIGLSFDGSCLKAVRSIYGGKVNANVSLRESKGYVATIRPGVFSPGAPGEKKGATVMEPSPLQGTIDVKKFIEYIEAPITGEDITQAEIIVSVGQGIGGPENIPMIEEVAKSLGGVIACSRPVVDRNWLPKERQVGISGKTVKPKVYIAIGISGAFQHVTAMQGSETIIAINKDPRAPIFGVADYGIVDDFQNVIPILKEKAKGMK